MKKILITAGCTVTPIDKVRNVIPWYEGISKEVVVAISNIFKGRTGSGIADYFAEQGEDVTIIASKTKFIKNSNVKVLAYKTYDELFQLMHKEISSNNYDVIIHSAAVSDYEVSGVYVLDENEKLVELDSSKKVSSSYKKLYLELRQTLKIVDEIRNNWNFEGKLIKFKLEVGKSDSELLDIAENSRKHSSADMIVANCLEWSRERAYVVKEGESEKVVTREKLPEAIYKELI